MYARILSGALAASLCAGAASAATPAYGTRDGDLACAGLLAIAYEGVNASTEKNQQLLVATISAYGVYIGRLSKSGGAPTKAAIGTVVDKMSNEEKTAFGRVCLTKAADLLRAPFADDQPSTPPRPAR